MALPRRYMPASRPMLGTTEPAIASEAACAAATKPSAIVSLLVSSACSTTRVNSIGSSHPSSACCHIRATRRLRNSLAAIVASLSAAAIGPWPVTEAAICARFTRERDEELTSHSCLNAAIAGEIYKRAFDCAAMTYAASDTESASSRARFSLLHTTIDNRRTGSHDNTSSRKTERPRAKANEIRELSPEAMSSLTITTSSSMRYVSKSPRPRNVGQVRVELGFALDIEFVTP